MQIVIIKVPTRNKANHHAASAIEIHFKTNLISKIVILHLIHKDK